MDDHSSGPPLQGLLAESVSRKPITIKKEPITNTYNVDSRPFARGKFATVRRCQHKSNGMSYAAKYMRKRRRASDVRHEILHEVYVLEMSAGNPHIVQLHEVYETPSEIILVLEMVPGGELQRVLDDEEVIPEREAARLLRQILTGLSFLHDHKIAHLDLKPQNILISKSFPSCEVKLCDFGISRLIGKDMEIREIVGTPDYVAPEILHYEPISLPTDMWSIGILTYVLLSGHSPFGGDTKQETFCNITRGSLEFPHDLFGTISNSAKDFIQRLLVRNARDRMSVKECLLHPWLNQDENHPAVQHVQITLSPSNNSHMSSLSDDERENEDPRVSLDSCSANEKERHVSLKNENGLPPNDKCNKNTNIKENTTHKKISHENIKSTHDQQKHNGSVCSVDMMVAEFEGLSVTKSIIFSEEIIKDERVAIVY